MAILTQHAPGTFCWPELSTSDQNAAKKFYGTLFGWTHKDIPMGPDAGFYTIFEKNGRECASLCTQQPAQAKMGVPPNWGAYVSVTSADETAAKAKSLGGNVLMEPFDVMGTMGRMAILQDPTGAVFMVWQPKDHHGIGIMGEADTLCWTELMSTDVAKAVGFYTSLLGWTDNKPFGDMNYIVCKRADGGDACGMMQMPSDMQGAPSNWMPYFMVTDVHGTVKKVEAIGGKVCVPASPIPGVGTFAVFFDPQGAVFAALQPEMP